MSFRKPPAPRPKNRVASVLGELEKTFPQSSVRSNKATLNSSHVRTHHCTTSSSVGKTDIARPTVQNTENATPPCQNHPSHRCEQYCSECETVACLECILSGQHKNHDVQNISVFYDTTRELILKDTQELESFISPFYDTIMSDIEITHTIVATQHEERKKTILELGKDLHQIVDNITKKYLEEEEKMETDDIENLQSLERKILALRNQVRLTIEDNNRILANRDFYKLIQKLHQYTSKNHQFRDVPERFEIIVSDFHPSKPTDTELCQIIGRLDPTVTKPIQKQRLPALRKGIDKSSKTVGTVHPHVLSSVQTGFTRTARVSCSKLHTDQFVVCGDSKVMKYFSKGKLLEEVTTQTGNEPFDLAVTRDGHLVYSDWDGRSIDIVRDGRAQCLIRLLGWRPQGVCSTSTNDLLVTMRMDDSSQSKVVRYSQAKVTQEIQYNDSRNPLYSNPAFIEENKNHDIVVSDWNTQAVVVVTRMGKFRFSYTGNPGSKTAKPFNPYGVATDSMCHILIADFDNNVVHILDRNGQFVFYIGSCHLQYPWDLSTDCNDNLLVAECYSNDVKQIKYF